MSYLQSIFDNEDCTHGGEDDRGGQRPGCAGGRNSMEGGKESVGSGISLIAETSRNRKKFAGRYEKWKIQYVGIVQTIDCILRINIS